MSLIKLYEVYALRREDDSAVRYFFKDKKYALIKYDRLKKELTDVVKNVRLFVVNDIGQKTED